MNKPIFPLHPPLAIFGVPVGNTDLHNALLDCIKVVQKADQTQYTFHVTSAECMPIATCYGWWPSSVNDANLLSIIRQADLSLASNKFLRTVIRCLGSSLAQAITTDQLLLSLCQVLGQKEKSIFLLGDADKAMKRIAIKCHDDFRGLRVVGVVSSPIFTEGEDLANSDERDALLVEQINASRTDVLAVCLGSPKQELWFERVRRRLNVPIVFTLGDRLGPLAGEIPVKQHQTLDEFMKTAVNIAKLSFMTASLIFYHTINRSLFHLFYKTNTSTQCSKNTQLFLSAHRSIAFISLPELIDASNVGELKQRFDEASNHDVVVFDFLSVRHIQPEGFHLLIEAWLQRKEQQKEIYGFCPISDIKSLMKVHHSWDLLKDTICDSAKTLMSRLSSRGELTAFFDTFMQEGHRVIISILGALDNRTDYDTYLRKLTPIIGSKECIFDLRYCTSIDNSGFAFLLTLRKQLLSHDHCLTLSSVNSTLRYQLRETKLDKLF
ncbi:MAG: WecB/TagA/CpsF family glycosyltransferase [Parachlamydiaceae bacterium]